MEIVSVGGFVSLDGQPDWAWMEQYVLQQMDKAEALVEHLDTLWN